VTFGECCSSAPPADSHAATRQCERRKDCPLAFDSGAEDCDHGTCLEHALMVNGVVLCRGCAAEMPSGVNTRSA